MVKSLHCRLTALTPQGGFLGYLRPNTWDVSFEHDDAGTLKLTYSRTALGGRILKRGLEQGLVVRFEVSDGGDWVEPYNGRFLLISRSRDAKDRTDTVTLNLVTWAWLLKKILNLNISALQQEGDNKGKRPFLSANPGVIVRTFLDENEARGGAAALMPAGFDTAHDSAGVDWARVMTLYYDAGIDLYTVLANLTANGVCDWRTDGMTLKMWNADSTALCRDLSGSVHIPLPSQLLESPEEETIEEMASNILVAGDNGLIFTKENEATPTPFGKWELYSSQGGVSDKGTAELLMQNQLDTAARVRGQYTRQILVENVTALPLVDYRPGDWITAPTVSNGEKVRVQRVSLSMSSQRLKCALILNDRLYDAQTRQAKKIQGITGGAVAGGSQGGRPSVNPENDTRIPKTPEGLVCSSDAYIDSNGLPRGLVAAQWAEVTQATDNTAMDIGRYEVQWRLNIEGNADWRSAGSTSELSISFGDLDCGSSIAVRVRAVGEWNNRASEWSEQVAVLVAADVTPPSVPSKPILKSDLGVVTIHWDGKNASGGGMEMDFSRLEVGRGDSANTLEVMSSNIVDVDDFIDTNVEPGQEWVYAFRALDYAGNRSDWSETSSITVASAIDQAEIDRINQDLADNQTAIDKANQDLVDNKATLDQAMKDLAAAQEKADQAANGADIAQEKADQAIKSTVNEYATSDTPTTAPTDGWSTTVPPYNPGSYIWVRTTITYGDGHTDVTDPVPVTGNTGPQGPAGADGTGVTILGSYDSLDELQSKHPTGNPGDMYLVNGDGYVWDEANRQWKNVGRIQGPEGPQGPRGLQGLQGPKGEDGLPGANGTSTYFHVAYADSADGSQGFSKGDGAGKTYIGTYVDSVEDDSDDPSKYQWQLVKGADGANGSNGLPGKNGVDGRTSYLHIAYANDSTGEEDFSTTDSDGKLYIGQYVDFVEADSTDPTKYKWTLIKGSDGKNGTNGTNGANGISVTSVTRYYQLASSKPAKPTVQNPSSPWTTTEPALDLSSPKYLYFADRVLYSNGSFSWSDVQLSSSYAAALEAKKTADGKNKVLTQAAEPAHTGLVQGDLWRQTNSSGQVIHEYVWNGSRFAENKLSANSLVVPSSIGATLIADGAVTTPKIYAGAITTEKIAANAVNAGKITANAVTADKLAANSVNADKITANAVTADKVAANAITGVKIASRSITSDKIVVGAITAEMITAGILKDKAGKVSWNLNDGTFAMGTTSTIGGRPVSSMLSSLDAAGSNASNAQQRAGVLETMIRMDSKGVRVGKTSNGTYTGPSVLVNSQGTVDIISSSDALLTRFQRYGFTVPFDTGAATIVASGGGFSINVAQNDGTKYAINLGAGGIGISAPDGTHVDCSSDTGALIETTKFGRLLIGTESLELTRGDATGLSMSNAGFSLKWAGGHQLATGPIAGALYIDGREILHV